MKRYNRKSTACHMHALCAPAVRLTTSADRMWPFAKVDALAHRTARPDSPGEDSIS